MEIVPIITFLLIIVTAILLLVLIFSFVMSKLSKPNLDRDDFDLITTKRPVYSTTVAAAPIEIVSSSRPQKLRSEETQIYYIDKLRDTKNNYRIPQSTRGVTSTNLSQSKLLNLPNSKPRYTIINNTMRKTQDNKREFYNSDYKFNKVSFY